VTTVAREDGATTELAFTLAKGQNQFFLELAEALEDELHGLGVPASVHVGELPLPRKGLVHVFLPPHEYVALSGHRPSAGFLRRSIIISAEQPQSSFFAGNVELAREAGHVFDINPRSVRAYRAQDVKASHLALGHTSLWDRFGDPGPERDIDILFLGRITPRRAMALASYADLFERFRCQLMLSDNARPNVDTGVAFVAGEDKRALLARSKVLLNIHGEDEPYFEWLRVAEAICAGCAVVSEHSTDVAPLEWGRHIVTGRLESLGLLCAWLAEDTERREQVRIDAYELLRQRPLSSVAHELAKAARDIDVTPLEPTVVLTARQERARQAPGEMETMDQLQPPERHDLSMGEALTLRALKSQQLAMTGIHRRLARMERMLQSGDADEPRTVVVAESPAWASGRSHQLTVVTPLYNHADEVLDALGSVERSSWEDWEAVIVDDGSSDGGGEAVRDWIESRPHLACRLVRHQINRGLAAARNTGIAQGRAGRLLMLDADNELRRITIARLMEALDADPAASFAYGIMEQFSPDGPQGLLSIHGWDPQRLRVGNYIDALALIRRDALIALNGYSHDKRLYGWEDYDLWARMAESGRHGKFVPEIIARYRVGHSSMISQTNVSTSDAYAAVADHAPRLMAGLRIPG
jgi:Glycosyl transferase family 2